MIDKGRCDDGFIWNPSVCECNCDKSCDAGQYLYYKNYKFGKELIDKLTEECSEDIDGNNMIQCDSKWIWKSMQVLRNIHSIISHFFFNNDRHLLCFIISIGTPKK